MASLAHLSRCHMRTVSAFRMYSNLVDAQREDKKDYDEITKFRVLKIRPDQMKREKRVTKRQPVAPPRYNLMPVDQDWTNVWPAPRTFHPATVPLPIRQGYVPKNGAPPSKFGNAELMKIPNFLHLTPRAIEKHCAALKQFCTPWPNGLETEEQIDKHFPVRVVTSNHCHSAPTIRQIEARRVKVSFKLSNLKFDSHAKDKFRRLVGDRYTSSTDVLRIETDRCPTRKQNYDYALYLITACYHESFIKEPWEDNKSEEDMEIYIYERNKSKQNVEEVLNWNRPESEPKRLLSDSYIKTVESIFNDGENEDNLEEYKQQVLQLLGIKQ